MVVDPASELTANSPFPEAQLNWLSWLLNGQVSVSQTKPDLTAPAGSVDLGLIRPAGPRPLRAPVLS